MKWSFRLFLGASLLLGSFGWCAVKAPDFIAGHSFYVGKSTTDTADCKIELLKSAKKSIEMSCGYADGEILRRVIDVLKGHLETNPAIQIHFMVSQNTGLFSKKDQQTLLDMKKAYPNNFKYLITDFSGLLIQEGGLYTTENHCKFVIVDEKYFQLGGTNLVDNLSRSEYDPSYDPKTIQQAFLPKASSDQDIIGSGPMAKKLREEFYMIWELYKTKGSLRNNAGPLKFAQTEYFPVPVEGRGVYEAFENSPDLIRNVKAYALVSGPRLNYHEIGDYISYYTSIANSTIDIAHMYFFPVDRLYFQLIDASKRNVAITLVTNGLRMKPSTSNSTIALYAYINRVNYLPIILGKTFNFWQKDAAKKSPLKPAKIYEYNVPLVLYHKKVMVFDNRYAVVGSYNLGAKSENSDFEVNVVIDSEEVSRQLLGMIEKDKPVSEEIGINSAIDWHFSFFYNIMKAFESTFFDGIILGVDVDTLPNEDDPKFKGLERTEFEWNMLDKDGFDFGR